MMGDTARRASLVGCMLLAAACQWQGENARIAFGWERMIDQPKYDAFEASPVFADGKVMRDPPPGTVPHGRERLPFAVRTGRSDTLVAQAQGAQRTQGPGRPPAPRAEYVQRVPLALGIDDVRRGRARFEIYCGVCHGADGSGVSRVAMNMSLRPPPSLVDGPVRALPPGRIFEVVTEGYGLMPSYATELDVVDRWRVVAYVQALRLAHRASLDSLSRRERERVLRQLPRAAAQPTDTVRRGEGRQ